MQIKEGDSLKTAISILKQAIRDENRQTFHV